MCRLFAYSGPPRDLAPFLLGEGSLEALACEHNDGWGLATWDAGVARVRKEPVAADAPKSGWRATVAATRAPLVLAHIRKGSTGRVTIENTHPFSSGPWAFAHNGTIQGMDSARAALLAEIEPSVRAGVRGATDSEVAFAMFLNRLLAYPEGLRTRLEDALPALVYVARRLRRDLPGTVEEPTKTTFLAGNGDGILGTRWIRELFVYQGEDFAVVASEPVGPKVDGWREVVDGATVVLQGGRVRVRSPDVG